MEKFNEKKSKITYDPELDSIRNALNQRESSLLSPLAAFNASCIRRSQEEELIKGYRQSFSLDADRILHSLAYIRYIDKTQVFYLIQNDHITHRMLHVQLVSKIARTIGRFLGLNEDLIEAVALGHDIGHTPFGHDGERILSQLCLKSGIGYFLHNVQSVQFLEQVERKGRGWNLCLQTLDGILCHDGEIHEQKLSPQRNKTFETLDAEILHKKQNPDLCLTPMTLEGCVVRMADTISYIGRDIEDAIRLNLIKRADIPKSCVHLLGDTNGSIVYHLVTDMIKNSYQKPYIAFSREVSEQLKILKAFNLELIYMNPKVKIHLERIRKLFELLFEKFLNDIEIQNHKSVIFRSFLKDMSPGYIESHSAQEIVRDFLAGMTDQYFIMNCPEHMRPEKSSI
ncbi:MAG: HD domain-containing protein [Desulfobacterales bacterium]